MRLLEQKVDVWGECPDIVDTDKFWKWIERGGRVCWNSEDKICEGSAKPFVDRITQAGHTSVLECSNICIDSALSVTGKYFKTDYTADRRSHYTAGNLRAWLEYFQQRGIADSLDKTVELLCEHAIPHEMIPRNLKRVTVEFLTNRAMSHEIVRHRVVSFLQLSQRYVDVKKGVDFIKPIWYDRVNDGVRDAFESACRDDEKYYAFLRAADLKPQQARDVLPNATATRIIVTGFLEDWDHFFYLRTASGADPMMRALAGDCEDKFRELGYIK